MTFLAPCLYCNTNVILQFAFKFLLIEQLMSNYPVNMDWTKVIIVKILLKRGTRGMGMEGSKGSVVVFLKLPMECLKCVLFILIKNRVKHKNVNRNKIAESQVMELALNILI